MNDAKEAAPNLSSSGTKGPDPLIGRVINERFRIESVIARGGMGKVYRAEQSPLGREVALKVLQPSYEGDHDPAFHKRFFLEASISSKLTHPNTVTIFDYGRTDDDVYYIAMELLEGRTLHRAIRDEAPFAPARAVHIARQVCRSLREAHGLGVIHRDLKPANVFLVQHGEENDFVKVLDFGLVKDIGTDKAEELTQTGLFMGSPKYMSPEQIRGDRVDVRGDIYSLGVILFEMMTGKVPYDRASSVNTLMAHIHEELPSMLAVNPEADVPPALEALVRKVLSKRPEDRCSNMDEFLEALKAAMAGVAPAAPARASGSGDDLSGTYEPIDVAMPAVTLELSDAELASPFADPRARTRKRWALAGVALLATLLGVVAAWGTGDDTELAAAPAAAPAPAPVVAPPAPVEPAPARVAVALRSDPPGATVVIGERQYGPTPTDVEWTGDEAATGREVTFHFQLDGYRDFTVTRTILGEQLAVDARMDPIAVAPTPRRTPSRRHTGSGESESGDGASVGLKGYKAEPY